MIFRSGTFRTGQLRHGNLAGYSGFRRDHGSSILSFLEHACIVRLLLDARLDVENLTAVHVLGHEVCSTTGEFERQHRWSREVMEDVAKELDRK